MSTATKSAPISNELKLEKRTVLGKRVENARKAGKMPVVVYGSKHATEPYFVEARDFKRVWRAAGESTLVSLQEGTKNYDVLIHEVAVHPLTGEPIHADFLAVDTSKPVEVKIALSFVGISPAVKNLGALLVKVMHEVEVKILPKYLVHEIEVDISSLENFGDQVHAKDLKLPETAELLTPEQEVLVLVAEPKEEVIEEPVAVDLSAIEVAEKGKKEVEGEEGEAPKGEDKK